MTIGGHRVAFGIIVLYAVLGFASAACPIPSDRADHTHHYGHQTGHTIGCAWACHTQTNTGAIDVPPSVTPPARFELTTLLVAHEESRAFSLDQSARAPPAQRL